MESETDKLAREFWEQAALTYPERTLKNGPTFAADEADGLLRQWRKRFAKESVPVHTCSHCGGYHPSQGCHNWDFVNNLPLPNGIAAERERCLKIVAEVGWVEEHATVKDRLDEIERRIREGK